MVATGQEMVRKSQEILSMIREAYDISVYSYWKNGCCSW